MAYVKDLPPGTKFSALLVDVTTVHQKDDGSITYLNMIGQEIPAECLEAFRELPVLQIFTENKKDNHENEI